MIKSQQDPADMLKKMADSMNLSVPEFEKMMREGHGLVPPDDSDDGEDEYYEPPKRVATVIDVSPDYARQDADRHRQALLDSSLSKYKAEEIANHIAQCVSAYGEVDERIEELLALRPTSVDDDLHENLKLEWEALCRVRDDKSVTTHQVDNLNSMVSTLSLMNHGKLVGRPIDLIAFKEGMERQMNELVASGTAREKRIAQFVIMAQQSAEALIGQSMRAPTMEATAMVMEKAVKIMEKATKMLESLDDMTMPKAGRLVEHVPDKQLPNNAKKSSEPTTEGE